MSLNLPPHEVHLWLCPLDEGRDTARLESCMATLDTSERSEMDRRLGARSQSDYALSHGFLRSTLSRYRDEVQPSAWNFARNEYGRPFIDSPDCGIHYSLSRTDELAAVGISSSGHLGIDVEFVESSSEHLDLAAAYFAPSEVAALSRVEESELAEEFYHYWTLKESYVKALGLGMSHSLASFAFAQKGGRLRVHSSEAAVDAPRWHFDLMTFRDEYRVAVCSRQPSNRELSLRAFLSTPLGDAEEIAFCKRVLRRVGLATQSEANSLRD